jgi:hypothetical protein
MPNIPPYIALIAWGVPPGKEDPLSRANKGHERANILKSNRRIVQANMCSSDRLMAESVHYNQVTLMNETPWGPVDIAAWRDLSVIAGKVATKQDVENANAVFFIPVGVEYAPTSEHPFSLPFPAIVNESGEPVFAVQCEQLDSDVFVGSRKISGGNGMCMLNQLEMLSDIDGRFF